MWGDDPPLTPRRWLRASRVNGDPPGATARCRGERRPLWSCSPGVGEPGVDTSVYGPIPLRFVTGTAYPGLMNRQPDMRQIMKQAQQMQEQLAKAQAELAEAKFEGSSGGGMVKAVVTGGPELIEISISPEVVDPEDVEMLEDLVLAAVRQATEEAVNAANNQLGGLAGGLGGLLG